MENEKNFFISDGINLIGPFSKEEVLRMLYIGEIQIQERIYDVSLNKWFKLENHKSFTAKDFKENNLVVHGLQSSNNNAVFLGKKKIKKPIVRTAIDEAPKSPKAPEKPKSSGPSPEETIFARTELIDQQSELGSERWFVQDGKFKIGPYHFLTLVSLILQGTITLDQSVRREDQKAWKAIDEIVSSRDLKLYRELDWVQYRIEMPRDLTTRKVERLIYETLIYIVSSGQYYIYQTYDLTSKTISFVAHESTLKVGDALKCILVSKDENLLESEGSVLRIDEVQSRTRGVKLYKYAVQLTTAIDLARLPLNHDFEDN